MLEPNYEEFLDSAKQIVDHEIIPFIPIQSGHIIKQFLQFSDDVYYQKIGEKLIVTKDWDQFDDLAKNGVLGNGTHALVYAHLNKYHQLIGKFLIHSLLLSKITYSEIPC